MPLFHSRDYVRQRNALIVEAEKIAAELVVLAREDSESNAKWMRCFSIAMDELARPLLNGADEASAVSLG